MLSTILIVILVLLLVGLIPNWHGTGYGAPGVVGVILIIVIILLLFGYIPR